MSPTLAAQEIRDRIGDRMVVASISGGKDSAAMSLYLLDLEIEHRRVFMDTGWEHAATYEYLRGELTRMIGPIEEIRSEGLFDASYEYPFGTEGGGMEALIRKKAMFPSRQRRFCTQELKVKPMLRYIAALDEDVVNTVGIRAAESQSRATMAEWE